METVPLTECCVSGRRGTRELKISTNQAIKNFIEINSINMCIRNTVKGNTFLHRVCPLGKTQLPLGVFNDFFFGKSAEKVQGLLIRRE